MHNIWDTRNCPKPWSSCLEQVDSGDNAGAGVHTEPRRSHRKSFLGQVGCRVETGQAPAMHPRQDARSWLCPIPPALITSVTGTQTSHRRS